MANIVWIYLGLLWSPSALGIAVGGGDVPAVLLAPRHDINDTDDTDVPDVNPHFTNMYGEQFNVYETGDIRLLKVPPGGAVGDTLLLVDAWAAHLGDDTCSVYLQNVTISGTWTTQTEPLLFVAQPHGSPKVMRFKQWIRFGGVDIKVVRSSEGPEYLNVYAKPVPGNGYGIGGLLGSDDHFAVARRPRDCSRRQALEYVASKAAVLHSA